MNIETESYSQQAARLPKSGQQIIGQVKDGQIVVYQAYNPQIADYAVKNQKFGGNNYSFSRMSWIKPNFLWMMYRSGWATKENQERILAIRFPIDKFEEILKIVVHSSYKPDLYENEESWKTRLSSSTARLQWDPDHDPYGNKLQRRAIQLGLKDETLKKFGTEWLTHIEDITSFVHLQSEKVKSNNLNNLMVPKEDIIH